MSLKKRRRYILIAVCTAIVLLALAGTFFLVRYGNAPHVSYQELGKATLPTITCRYKDKQINRMYGYTKEMDIPYMRDTLYILQDVYDIEINIDKTDINFNSLRFRVLDMPGNNLIQDTDAFSTLSEQGDSLTATLQIDNIIDEDKEYSLEIILGTPLGQNVHYYTRILKSSAPYLEDHMELIENAHNSTFNYDTCSDVFSPYKSESDYLYDDTSSFGRITLYSTIRQISWDDMNVSETVKPTINIVDFDNELAFFRMDFQVGCELNTTTPQYYNVSEYYRTRINAANAYLLDYERTADQIFTPNGNVVSSDHVNLGILSDENAANVNSMCSPDGNRTAFVANKELWLMSTKTKELTSIFRFIADTSDLREIYDQHNIKIIDVTDEGDVRFILYGYMNKGIHEGSSGISLCTFRYKELKVTEDIFIPSDIPYQLLKYSIGNLCYMNNEGFLYIMINGTIYSIDPSAGTAETIVSGLSEESCKVSEDGSRIAWQENGNINGASKINVLDMDSLETYSITAQEGKSIKVMGFLNNDLIYGEGDTGSLYVDSNDVEHLLMSHMYAADNSGQIQNDNYEEGFFFISGTQEYNRLIAERVTKTANGYAPAESFTIFSTDRSEYPGATTSIATEETRGIVTLLSFPVSSSQSAPLNIISSTDAVLSSEEISNVSRMVSDKWHYYVYAKGKLISPEESASDAIRKAYDNTGCAVRPDGSFFYRRGMRAATAEIPQDIIDAAVTAYKNDNVLNVTGIELAQAMSFISHRNPLIWEQSDGHTYVITGYTTSDALVLYDIETGQTTYMAYNTADGVFATDGRVLVYEG